MNLMQRLYVLQYSEKPLATGGMEGFAKATAKIITGLCPEIIAVNFSSDHSTCIEFAGNSYASVMVYVRVHAYEKGTGERIKPENVNFNQDDFHWFVSSYCVAINQDCYSVKQSQEEAKSYLNILADILNNY